MATLIDREENLELDEDLETEEQEQQEPELQEQETEDNPEEVPEKYRGKSAAELIRMHQEAEKAVGRKGSELGELRKLADQLIAKQIVETAPPPQAEDDDLDIFTDPDKYLDSKLSKHPAILELAREREQNKRVSSQERLKQKHPDFQEIMQDQSFAKWIQDSTVRTKLFIEADQGFDADAADELFSNWKKRKALAIATANADKSLRKEEVRKASTGGASGSATPPAQKIYRRADIRNLISKDPDRYAQMADELLLAYKEGRVR